MKMLRFAALLVAPAMSLQAKDVVPPMPSATPLPAAMPQEPPMKPSTALPTLEPAAPPVTPIVKTPVMEKNPVPLPEIPLSEKLAMELPRVIPDQFESRGIPKGVIF